MDEARHIQFIEHRHLDKAAWDNCINNACNSLLYGTSLWLDAMSPNWHGLVYKNYEAVMGLTWRRKWGISYLYQPAFTQQLGVFYTEEKQQQLVPFFLQQAAEQFRFAEIFLNHANMPNQQNATNNNFILPLHQSYETLKQGYKKDLLNNLKRSEKYAMLYSASDDAAASVALFKTTYQQRLGAKSKDYENFSILIQKLIRQKQAFIRNVNLPSGELLATSVFAIDANRIYNLASTTLPNGRTLEANHFLFDALIQEFSNSHFTLDFEGSDQPGIARFYQKFGSKNQPYFFYRYNQLPAMLRWLKR